MLVNSGRKIVRFAGFILSISVLMLLAVYNVNAASTSTDVTITCKMTSNRTLVDISSLGITISSAVPVGTVVYSGSATADVKCAMNNLQQFLDGMVGEIYFKRNTLEEGALGYGLTLYTGYGGEMGNEAANIATGIMVNTYNISNAGEFVNASLPISYQIVRTSNDMTPFSSITKKYVNPFNIGSLVSKTANEVPFNFAITDKSINAIDQTCSVSGNKDQSISLGSYTTSRSSGLGAGIGQTSDAKSFAINLNCEALLSGNFDVMMQFDGDPVSGLSDQGVVALSAGSTASGVGVQILNENQQPITLASPFRVAAFPLSSSLVTVPLYARYYQTESKINPGTANAVATYTLSYQ